jgi:methionine aminopeptidase
VGDTIHAGTSIPNDRKHPSKIKTGEVYAINPSSIARSHRTWKMPSITIYRLLKQNLQRLKQQKNAQTHRN